MLTDDELSALWDGHAVPVFGKNGINPIIYARAVIASHEAKLREQEPICWITPSGEGWRMRLDPPVTNTKLGWQPLWEHPAPTPEGWTAIHLKTGNEYQVIGEAIDATNTHSNQLMVIYQRDGKTFVREAEEFQEKFKAAERGGE